MLKFSIDSELITIGIFIATSELSFSCHSSSYSANDLGLMLFRTADVATTGLKHCCTTSYLAKKGNYFEENRMG